MQSDVKALGKFSHPNLVKLLGYCWENGQFLLVYEYMQKGSLENHLFRKGLAPLPWETRLNIAKGEAQGHAFLHTTEKQVIYRDFKASKILLDGDFNAKLSDCGLAKLGPTNGNSHVTTSTIGTYGYVAPEYFATGLRVIDMNRSNNAHNLIEWARPFLPDKRKLNKIMDPRLENHYPSKAAFQAAKLILQCPESNPKNQPSMKEVLEALQQVNAIKMKPKGSKAGAKHTATATQHQQQDRHPPGNSQRYGHD
ncbi:probable serine/threonine-protein kinase PIX13 isoform X2 [Camellia sinensis]|uniref:probable serine/threonine-protein kinase PIX13 isoform X2 n=1 Tax=Camellia sinensis TaxID=4442 RepID=UPI001036E813|nr:probable serine/threonine-protein kinase PIX13 isoform X2 [Camellia sinensis]